MIKGSITSIDNRIPREYANSSFIKPVFSLNSLSIKKPPKICSYLLVRMRTLNVTKTLQLFQKYFYLE